MIEICLIGTDNKERKTTAMIDCGASTSFIERTYVDQHAIPLERKKKPNETTAVDGRPLEGGPTTHHANMTLRINNHEEAITLHNICIGSAPVILGRPWLRKHNPQIDWKNDTVSFTSKYCADNCLPTSHYARVVPEKEATRQFVKDIPVYEEQDEAGLVQTKDWLKEWDG